MHADVLLHLSTVRAEGPPKRQRTGSTALSHARTYHLHAIVLSAKSSYFGARLNDDSNLFKPDVEQRGSTRAAAQAAREQHKSTIRYELVEYVEEEELAAMEVLLRSMYTGQVDKAPSAVLIMQALGLAHRFLASDTCIEALGLALSEEPVESIGHDA